MRWTTTRPCATIAPNLAPGTFHTMPISPQTECQLSTYEQPLNERIRLFMRLESMFFQMKNFHQADEYYSIQLFLDALFDVLDFLHRYEIRAEIIKELQGYKTGIDREHFALGWTLEERVATLENIDMSLQEAYSLNFNPISALRENELFTSLRQRNFNQSGNCLFEVPAYQYWLLQNENHEIPFLQQCYEMFLPIARAVALVLQLVRAGAEITNEYTDDGIFLKTLDSNRRNQMIRIHLDNEQRVFPRISGDKHRFSVRFMTQENPEQRAKQVETPVQFSLQTCVL